MEDSRGDAELIRAVRAGRSEAYDVLYRRHLPAARAMARQLSGDPADRDDLVAEAFARLLATLRGGGGPDTSFRAYLLTVLRHVRYDRARHDGRLRFTDDMAEYDPGVPWRDGELERLEHAMAARALAALPERWRTVLWRTEVDGAGPAELAAAFGLSANGVSALAYRAREGLRQAYLQEHLGPSPHQATVGRLGAWARGGLSPRRRARVDAHLAHCPGCRDLADEVKDVSTALPA